MAAAAKEMLSREKHAQSPKGRLADGLCPEKRYRHHDQKIAWQTAQTPRVES